MPELPEVETICQDLRKKIIGRRIIKLKILEPKLIKNPTAQVFIEEVTNRKFEEVRRRGKYLIFCLNSGKVLVIHLKLTGVLLYLLSSVPLTKQTRIIFKLDNDYSLRFLDRRKFGALYLVSSLAEIAAMANLGPEPLQKEFTFDSFYQRMKNKKRKIKSILLDQGFVAGLGNIYVNEVLYQTKVHPVRITTSIKKAEASRLYQGIRDTLRKAIAARGTSVNTYRNLSGERGKYGFALKVYGFEGKRCHKCGGKIERMDLEGRGTYFCPKCQKL
ncbi:MAG: bifunctional DNA-formamidopyrimidine glycosylase/DNA-(apurinic or apyrimidinic site) lyase [Candidatus Edwardsbacteria bacterium]